MKTSNLLLFLLLFSVLLITKSNATDIKISLYDDSEFMVIFGVDSYWTPLRYADFKNLSGGEYYLRVMKKKEGFGINYTTLYENYIDVPRSGRLCYLIDETNNLVIANKESNNGWDKYSHFDNNWDDHGNWRTPMKDCDFSDLVKVVSDRTFESTKIDFAKDGIDKNYFSTDQVRTLLGLFTFESTKLDMAKYIYQRTVDKKNYFRLYDMFVFESSVRELHDYLNSKN